MFAAPADLEPLATVHSGSSAASPADFLCSGGASPVQLGRHGTLWSPGQQVLSREGSLMQPLQAGEDAEHAMRPLLLPEGHGARVQAPSATGVQLRKPPLG